VTSTKPMPRAQTTAFIFSQFTTRGAIHYMGLPEQVSSLLDDHQFFVKNEPGFLLRWMN
jgi:hypothetical protein